MNSQKNGWPEQGGTFAESSNAAAKAIVSEAIKTRNCGQIINETEIIARHPELATELTAELKIAAQIHQAMLAAQDSEKAVTEFALVTDSKFDALVSDTSVGGIDENFELSESLPRIPGYGVTAEINRGGQAVVYLATQETTGRSVAIKVMAGGPFVKTRHRQRFDREIKILAKLDHPNIVSILQRGRTPDGSFFFVMPFVDGRSLEEYWLAEVPCDSVGVRQLVRLFSTIASAVEEAHSRGVVHRDLKPANIRIDHRGEPHVLDFGLARSLDETMDRASRSITLADQVIGSLPWASPEQAAGKSAELSPASDVYSLGVTLFQAIAGQFPYTVDGPIDEVLRRIRTARPEAPSKFHDKNARVDRTLDAIVLKSLAKDPLDRYPSAGGLAQDLKSWLAGSPVIALHPKPARFRKSTVAFALLTVGLGAMAFFAYRSTKTFEPAFRLPTIQNKIGMRFVLIPPGSFMMGSLANEVGRDQNEQRRRVVVDHAYYLATTEVTQAQFEQIMHENPSDRRWLGPMMPVQNVSYQQAEGYCRRLSDIDHLHYRLPTEAEWEYACRAKFVGAFPDPIHPETVAASLESTGGNIENVAARRANAWGLFDMQGNVREWCSNVSLDTNVPDRQRNASRTFTAARGGSALLPAVDCRAASREVISEMSHQSDLGFRVARDP